MSGTLWLIFISILTYGGKKRHLHTALVFNQCEIPYPDEGLLQGPKY